MTITMLEAASWAFVNLAVQTVLRSLFLACLTGCAVYLFRSRTAALRFELWKWTLFALLALPLLIAVTPPLSKPPGFLSRVELRLLPVASTPIRHASPSQALPAPLPHRPRLFPAVLCIPALYLLVTLALLVRLVYNTARLRAIVQQSSRIFDPRLRELVTEIWLESGAFAKPQVAVSTGISAPVTFNAGDAWILLPSSYNLWDQPKFRAVLTHEMSHVQRDDAGTLLFAALTTCLFWFHPLSWFLRRQLAVLAEEACDEVVLARGVSPDRYSTLLIDFARDVQR
ncbi:MAG: M56 family metallopeptidase [Bryobacteraceae bacterium]